MNEEDGKPSKEYDESKDHEEMTAFLERHLYEVHWLVKMYSEYSYLERDICK